MSGRRKRGKKADLIQKNCELQNNLHVASANDAIEMESGVDDMLQGEDDEGAFSYLAARDDEDILDRSHSTIDDVLPERNDEGVLPDMEGWDNEDVSEEYDSSVDDMLLERNDGEGFSDIGGWNNEDASEEYDSSVDGMLPEENVQEVFSNLDSYAKEDKTNGMVAHNKEDRRKLVLKTYGAFRASRQKFKAAKKSQEKSADVKDTSLIHMEQLFKNSGVIHKFLWGHDCYFNEYHYEVLTEEAFCALCKNCIDKDVQGKITRMHNYTDLYKFVTLHDPNETIAETKENYFVSFTNGVLDVHSLEFYFRHDPQFEVAFTVNAEYHPTDSKHMAYRCFYETVTYDFLNQMCDGDKDSLQLILQMIGFLLLHVTPKRAFFWMGPAPASGKGVLLDLICRLLGSEQCCHIDAQKMGGKFSVSQLFKRRVILGLESCGKLSSAAISTIKTLSGDSIMPIERKFKEGEDIPNYTKIVFASNEPINISESDMTDAFWDRCKLIFCGKSCAKNQRDPFLIDKLWEEREILMSVVAWEAHELILNDFRFIEPEISATIKHQWRYMNENPISTFLRERVKIHGKACSFISTEELFDAFIQYTGVTTMNIKSFSSQLTKYSPAVLMRKKGYAPDKRRVNGFVNIELVDEGD